MVVVQLSSELSVRDVRRDEGRDGQGGRRAEEEGDFPDSADVLDSVGRAESEVLMEYNEIPKPGSTSSRV